MKASGGCQPPGIASSQGVNTPRSPGLSCNQAGARKGLAAFTKG